jgi:hypothetical protein
MPPSDRDLVLQWLAERIDAAQPVSGCVMCLITEGQSGGPCVAHRAAAILDTPGVDIASRNYWAPGNPIGDDPDGVRLLLCLPPMLTTEEGT